ncbi:hypothetical protein Elgi_62950 [Paenibacillus elgii]|nr:hypothetical protein Elgi_62950 [Paenibacillus elgii]
MNVTYDLVVSFANENDIFGMVRDEVDSLFYFIFLKNIKTGIKVLIQQINIVIIRYTNVPDVYSAQLRSPRFAEVHFIITD